MRILKEYTLDFIRRNKRTSIAITIAIFLTTTLLSCLCGMLYTMWSDSILLTKNEDGDWHGELFDKTYGKNLSLIKNYSSVDAVMIKGTFYVGKIDDPRRPYLTYRDANAEYWNSMAEKNAILRGRIPEKPGEIVISKQYFETHPELSIGDTLFLPVGDRMQGGERILETAPLQENEVFNQTGSTSVTIVGELDAATSSETPAYYAMGYLDESQIKPDDIITVYLRFDSMRSTYEELPKLAEALGWDTDEYDRYQLKYNTKYLSQYLIFSPEQQASMTAFSMFSVPIMYGVFALIAVLVFVVIIHSAFTLSAHSRLSQLGILASIGASPKQIKKSVIFEGFLLTIIPLPMGLLAGWGLDTWLIALINSGNSSGRGISTPPVELAYGLPSMLPTILLALLTVWLSSRIPARKIAKMSPIDAIRQGDGLKIKKMPRHRFMETCFGIEGELAANALSARKKAYRTATLSLTLSFLLILNFWNIIACNKSAVEVYGNDAFAEERDITFQTLDGKNPDRTFMEALSSIDGIKHQTYYSKLPASIWLTQDEESSSLKEAGGFHKIAATKKYNLISRDNRYRVYSLIFGMDDISFRDYCSTLGIDPAPYYNLENPQAIVYNQVSNRFKSTRKDPAMIEFLNLSVGQQLSMNDKVSDEDTGTYQYDITIGHLTDRLPALGQTFPNYSLYQIMPRSVMQKLASNCQEKRRLNANKITGIIKADSYDEITPVNEKITELCDSYLGSGDYQIYDIKDTQMIKKQGERTMNLIVNFITGLLAVIGLSNVWATVSGTLQSRRKEFAMLRSAGLSPKGIKRMLTLESIFFGFTPLLLSLPVSIVIVAAFIRINEITVLNYLSFAPVLPIFIYTLLVVLAIVITYTIGRRKLQKENILDAIRDESL